MATAISINPLRVAAFAAAIVCALLLLLYAHRRKPFILLWAAGWLLIAPAMLLVSRTYASAIAGNVALGASQLLGICIATLFLWSADLYRNTRYVTLSRLKALLPFAAWFLVAPMALGPRAAVIPGYLCGAAILAAAGSMYVAVLLERRMIGAGLVAFVLYGQSSSNLASAFAPPPTVSFEMLVLNTILFTFGALGVHLLVFEDMTYELRVTNRRLEIAQQELLYAAITDPLTGCHNRRFLEQVADRELQRHARFDLPLSLLFIDIDRFKAVNDTLGHEAGDRVLQYVARFLKRNIREADYVFRWGGDEFLALITCSSEQAERKAAMLKSAFDAAPEAVDLPPGIGLSIGSIDVPPGTTDLAARVREADARMYQDKGRAHWAEDTDAAGDAVRAGRPGRAERTDGPASDG